MRTQLRSFLFLASLAGATAVSAQIAVGGRVGANYAIESMRIQPDPKDPPTNPKGLGMVFGAYVEIPFSDMVGLRPELGFSFRRIKMEATQNKDYNNEQVIMNTDQGQQQGALTAKEEQKSVTDQRLQYFQINVPIMITPAEGFRFMVGPSFNFLMGGKQTTDDTYILKGTFTPNGGQQQQVNVDNFETSDKKGSTAIKHFRKADVAVMAGLGYTLDMGFDVDLRYYRSLSTTYDEQSGSSRLRLWTNLVELTLGWTFNRE